MLLWRLLRCREANEHVAGASCSHSQGGLVISQVPVSPSTCSPASQCLFALSDWHVSACRMMGHAPCICTTCVLGARHGCGVVQFLPQQLAVVCVVWALRLPRQVCVHGQCHSMEVDPLVRAAAGIDACMLFPWTCAAWWEGTRVKLGAVVQPAGAAGQLVLHAQKGSAFAHLQHYGVVVQAAKHGAYTHMLGVLQQHIILDPGQLPDVHVTAVFRCRPSFHHGGQELRLPCWLWRFPCCGASAVVQLRWPVADSALEVHSQSP
jgi:hypothetical protein